MHILILPSWYPKAPGDDVCGVFFREQAIALAATGCKVGVLAADQYPIKKWKDWRWTPSKVNVSNDDGVQTYRIQITAWFARVPKINAKWQAKLWRHLYKHYEKDHGKPDLIHVHSCLPSGLAALELKKAYSIPYVITEHSTAFMEGLLSRTELAQAVQIAKAAQRRWAVSSTLGHWLEEELEPNAGPWQTMPNLVPRLFHEQPPSSKASKPFIFLNVCIHERRKNVDILIRAFAQKFQEWDDVLLELGGLGPETPRLIKLADRLGVAHKVRFLGMLSRKQVRAAMARAHAFVLSSQVETFGIVLIEALAMGLPLIATNCGGPSDIVTPLNGILVDIGDIEAMSSAMMQILRNASTYQNDSLREDCLKRFGEDIVVSRLQTGYRDVLNKLNTEAIG